jgi:hypothetical protein|tara:strand:+ start:253 stop:921 length:669 start_codon:yes stop_codon:yes gene_type:complete
MKEDMDCIRDIVIRTDETVKNLKEDFERHEKEGNKKYDRLLEHSMTCVESSHIKEQNSKIDKMITILHKLQSKRVVEISDVIKSIVVIATIVGITFGVMHYFNKAHGEEQKQEYTIDKSNTPEEIEEIIKIFNDYIVSKNLGFKFECNNPESAEPTIKCFTSLDTEYCLKDEYKIKWILRAISIDWNMYTDSKKVDLYSIDKILVFQIDKEGNFNIMISRLS